MEIEQQKPALKLIEVKLSALTRVEYTEIVEVPANITEDELNELVNERYRNVDGGEFTKDPEYWERGTCYAVDSDMPNAVPTMMAFRTEHGLHVERADADACERANSSNDSEGTSPAGYLASLAWGHIFIGHREETTRWIYDCAKQVLVNAQILNGNDWVNIDGAPMADLLQDIHDNDANENPAEFGLIHFDSLPSWQEVSERLESSETPETQRG